MIREALDRLLEGRTAVVIAHRLSTIQHADRILVFHKGRLREQGSHQELLALRGIYYRLYQLQYKEQELSLPVPGAGCVRDSRSRCRPMTEAAARACRNAFRPLLFFSPPTAMYLSERNSMSAPEILISAGEASSDMYAARLATALRARTGATFWNGRTANG